MNAERYKEIYSHVYAKKADYGAGHGQGALPLVSTYTPYFHGVVVDCGCGRHQFTGSLKQNRPQLDVYGIDIVRVEPVPEGVTFLEGPMWDLTRCPERINVLTSFDALEHLYPEDVERTLQAWSERVVGFVVFSIAHQSSINRGPNGIDLHPTIRNKEWWSARISKYFDGLRFWKGYWVATAKGADIDLPAC